MSRKYIPIWDYSHLGLYTRKGIGQHPCAMGCQTANRADPSRDGVPHTHRGRTVRKASRWAQGHVGRAGSYRRSGPPCSSASGGRLMTDGAALACEERERGCPLKGGGSGAPTRQTTAPCNEYVANRP